MRSSSLITQLSAIERCRFERIANALARQAHPATLILNSNHRILISLRGGGSRPIILSIHAGILAHAQACEDLPHWVKRGGRRTSPAMRQALDEVGKAQRALVSASQAHVHLDPLDGPIDLQALLEDIRHRYFPSLPTPKVQWSRRGRTGTRRHVRFGSYRSKPTALIRINPRLNQAWVARAFVEFVLYHELCHHAQMCSPLPGETAHGKRFRLMERQFPDYERILRWERENLDRFLTESAIVEAPTPEPMIPLQMHGMV